MPTPLASIRMPKEMIQGLKTLARQQAVLRCQDITWPMLVRELIQERLLEMENLTRFVSDN